MKTLDWDIPYDRVCLTTVWLANYIVELCASPMCFGQLLKQLFDDCSLTITFEQYVLVGSPVRSYLAWLKDSGRLSVEFKDNLLLWMRKE